jgi:hypothetical protein
MGAVKTNRRVLMADECYCGNVYWHYAELAKTEKIGGRLEQNNDPETDTNNRRKLHGKPMKRRVMS